MGLMGRVSGRAGEDSLIAKSHEKDFAPRPRRGVKDAAVRLPVPLQGLDQVDDAPCETEGGVPVCGQERCESLAVGKR